MGARHGILAACTFTLTACLGACGSDAEPTRLETRASISGRIALAVGDGLDDMSRVRVDIGRGEGGVTPEPDGSFSFSDLEPDAYALKVTYSGGLGNASGSAYQPYEFDVVARQGGSVNLGLVELPLGVGTVSGMVTFSGGPTADGSVVRLAGDELLRETTVVAGSFMFERVPVGAYTLSVVADGAATAMGAVCAASVSVSSHGETVTSESFALASPAVTLTPSASDVAHDAGTTIYLSQDRLTLAVAAAFATEGRAWIGEGAAPAYAPLDAGGFEFTAIPAGRNRLRVQLRDACGFEAAVIERVLIRDDQAPTVQLVQLAEGKAWTTEQTVGLVVAATDDLSDLIEMRWVLCAVDAEDTVTCNPDIGDGAWQAYLPRRPVTLDPREGRQGLRVQLRDRSANLTEPIDVTVGYDATAPSNISITIGPGAVIRTPSPVVRISATGADEMKLGTVAGLAGRPWVPFSPEFRFDFDDADGPKTLFVQLRDFAGNESAELSAATTLDTTGRVSGRAALEDGADPGGIEVILSRTATDTFSAVTAADGAWTLPRVRAGGYDVTYRVTGPNAARYELATTFVTVVPGVSIALGTSLVPLARGGLAGVVTLEGRTNYDGVAVELVGTTERGATAVDGTYQLARVPVGAYTLRLSADGYAVAEISSLVVSANQVSTVATQQLNRERGSIGGVISLEGLADSTGVQVDLLGTNLSASTNVSGLWRIDDVPVGSYDVRIAAAGFRDTRLFGIDVRAQVHRDIGTIELVASRGRVVGTVRLEGQTFHGGVELTLGGTAFQTFSDAGGVFIFNVPPRTFNGGLLAVRSRFGNAAFNLPIVVREEQAFNIGELFLPATQNDITGTVNLFGRAEHSQVLVTASGENGTAVEGVESSTVSAENGTFAVARLPLGRYRVTFTYLAETGWETFTTAGVQVAAGPPAALPLVSLRERFIQIEANAQATISRNVMLMLGASDCFEMQVSNRPDLSDATFQTCQSSLPWALTAGDGIKTVYARFTTNAAPGTPTDIVSDTILLDTTIGITTFAHDAGARVVGLGDTVHFALDAGEPLGRATVAIAGYTDSILLRDDGLGGDVMAGDGVYELDYVIQIVGDADTALVTGNFTDQFGNFATLNAVDAMTVAVPPLISNIRLATDSNTGDATISWNTDEPTTGEVRWGTTVAYGTTTMSAGTALAHAVVLPGLVAAQEYNFQIASTDLSANASTSSNRQFFLVPGRPEWPAAIAGIGVVHVRWESPQQDSIAGYHVYRATTAGGPYTRLTATPYNHEALMYEDAAVTNGTTYHYVVTSVDTSGNESENSAERTATPVAASTGPTMVQGALTGVNVWSEAGSPYIMTGGISVQAGAILAIGPRTEVRVEFNAEPNGYRFIVEGGRLVVLGRRGAITSHSDGRFTESDDGMAQLTSNAATPAIGDWRGITFEATSAPGQVDTLEGVYRSGHLLYRARIAYTDDAANVAGNALSVLRSTFYSVRRAVVGSETVTPLRVVVVSSTVTLSEPYQGSATVQFGAGGSIGSQTLIDRCTFTRNITRPSGGGGGGVVYQAVNQGARLSRSFFSANETNGNPCVADVNSTAIIEDNVFVGNGANVSGSGQALYMDGCGRNFRDCDEGNKQVAVGNRFIGNGSGATTPDSWTDLSLNAGSTSVNDGVGGGGAFANHFEGVGARSVSTDSDMIANVFIIATTPLEPTWGPFLGWWAPVSRWNHFVGTPGAPEVVLIRENFGVNDWLGRITESSFLVPAGSGGTLVRNQVARTGSDSDVTGTYWGPDLTAEMNLGANPKNISGITDFFDDVELSQADYAGFAQTAYPLPRVDAPRWGWPFDSGETITFRGHAIDPEDGALAPAQLEWRTDAGALLGTGDEITVNTLAPGPHRIWLYAFDSNNQRGGVPIDVEVRP